MTSKQRSIFGSILLIISTLCLAFILSRATESWGWYDATENKRYSLTEGTEKILQKVTRPLKATLFYSKTAVTKVKTGQLLRFNRAYDYTRDLLAAYQRLGDGKIEFEEIDPKPYTDEADLALDYGIRSFPLPNDQLFFFGLAITSDAGHKEVMPFINANEENLFEYKITKMIERVARPVKKKVGIMSTLPIVGEDLSPEMRRLRQFQGQQGGEDWNIVRTLRADYEIEKVETTVDRIPEDLKFLMLVHPKDLTDKTLYAIDQFVMRGGKLLVLQDPFCLSDQPPPNPRNRFAGISHPRSSDVNKISSSWGVKMATDKIIGDRKIVFMLQGRIPYLPYVQFRQAENSFSDQSVITEPLSQSETAQMLVMAAGSLETIEAEGVTVTPLLQTTSIGGLRKFDGMTQMTTQQDPGKLWQAAGPDNPDGFERAGKALAAAVVATGKFKSAFPEGLPGGAAEGEKPPEHLKEAKESNAVVVVADVDLINNDLIVAPDAMFGNAFSNRGFILNSLDFLAGSGELMSIRSRGSARREFTEIQKVERQAAERTEDKVAAINAEIESYRKKLNELSDAATKKTAGVIKGEQYKQQAAAQKAINAKQRELRDVQREARESVESIKSRAEFLNTLGMPLLVALIGLILWFVSLAKRSQKMREDMA